MIRSLLALALIAASAPARAQDPPQAPPRVVLVTIDGYRWQDLFRGADPSLVADPRYRARYVDIPDPAQALTPFLLSFRHEGALIGDRDNGSCARVSNEFWFSYPGYAEILAGRPNPRARSNQKIPNDDVTVLERLNNRQDIAGQVRVYAEWSAVPYILNVARSQISVMHPPEEVTPHDPIVRDAAREIFTDLPRVTWIAFGDTDNRAHEGKYEEYLAAATEADQFLAELWTAIESNPATAGRTTMIVTTDHGRGEAEDEKWRGHGSGRWRNLIVPGLRREGSDAVFIAARGPNVRPGSGGEYNMEKCASVSQLAATVLHSLDLAAEIQPDMASALDVWAQ